MRQEKRKNTSLTGSQTAAFILLWCASYAIGCAGLWLTLEALTSAPYQFSFFGPIFREWDVTTFFIFFGLAIPGLFQTLLVRRFLFGSPRGWISLTLVGLMISWVILHLTRVLILEPRHEKTMSLEFLIPALFIPAALIQTIWLVQNVKRAWIWPLASLLGTIVFLLIFSHTMRLSSLVIGGLVYGLIMGLTMFYLHIDVLWYSERFEENG
jgi:hypothetical protein